MKLRGSPFEYMAVGALLALDSVCRLIPRTPRDLTLIVRVDAVGDHFLWLRTGAVQVSRYAKAEAGRTVLIASPAVAPYARETGLWDEVLELSELRFGLNPLYRLKMLWRIRRLGAALLIQPRASRALWLEDAIARVCGIPRRIGCSGTLLRESEPQRMRGNRYYEQLIPIDGGLQTHESTRNAQFSEGLTGCASTEFRFDRPAKRPVGSHVMIALGAGAPGRLWPIENLARLVRHIGSDHPNLRIVVAGTKADAADAERLRELSGIRFDNRVGRTSLRAFVELVADSRLVICNESAAYHLAMTYERDVVCMLGGGHFGIFVPYPAHFPGGLVHRNRARHVATRMSCFGCNWRCIYSRSVSGAYKCVHAIPVEPAAEAVDALLRG